MATSSIGDYLAHEIRTGHIDENSEEFITAEAEVKERLTKLCNINGTKTVDYFHKKLGKIMWDHVGMARNEQGLKGAMAEIKALREEFWKNVNVPGTLEGMNQELEKAGRVADLLELGELMALDALTRNESAGGHFREEYQTPEGEALRDDEHYAFTSAWEWTGDPGNENLHKEQLVFDEVELKQRSYK